MKISHDNKKLGYKYLLLLLAVVVSVGGVIGGSLAWLTAESGPVANTFTLSTINITLTESDTKLDGDTSADTNDYKMIPGYILAKDPKVTVVDGSEDCWLFVKITESTNPDLDRYIAYAIASGWTTVVNEDSTVVVGRRVYQDDTTKSFAILGEGNYTYNNGTEDTSDDVTVQWAENQVGVKPEVTETMMEAIKGEGKTQPTLDFAAYAVQLYKTNSDGNKDNTSDEFTIEEAWEMTPGYTEGT